MRSRRFIWILIGLLLVAGAWLFWRPANRPAGKSAAPGQFSYTAPRPALPGQLPANQPVPARVKAALATNALAFRLSNTTKSIGELVTDPQAILLENALIDTRQPLNLSIPKKLQASGDPGAYIVQSRGPITAAFRAALAQAGAQIVSYIPNDAYLVRIPASGANGLASNPLTQSVVPYEPYYKIQSSLLGPAINQTPLPAGAVLNLGLFADAASQTIQQIGSQPGVQIVAQDRSPFGPIVRVQVLPMADWTALAALPGVQIVEAFHPRVHANDLSRVNTGVAPDTLISSNYLNLTGLNVLVAVNDSGIDATHPDFSATGTAAGGPSGPSRVLGLTPTDLLDTIGHGTHVAGIIAGNGSESLSPVPNYPKGVGQALAAMNFGSVSNADFRGKAQLAALFSVNYDLPDYILQTNAASVGALISNNSWNNNGDSAYDLAAASYDAATRDALPETTGSQPVLFVFSAGNAGGGDDTYDPGGGNADSIQSPATAKNVITVGAIQELRNITNKVTQANGTTNQPWLPETSTSYRIAGFSSRGNVGIGLEGAAGRFKPDVVAPGTFIVSTRSSQWDTYDYFYLNPTNYDTQFFPGVIADPNSLFVNGFPIVPNNAIGVNITVSPANTSLTLPIYFAMIGSPFPGSVFTVNNQVNIPSDGGFSIANILNSETFYGFNYAVSNITSSPISFDLTTTIITTNGRGNQNLVLSNLDNTLGPYYRFETGTSMAAADVSGVLALMQDFFTNTLHITPSPALLKALLINGARPTGGYNLQVSNVINFEGWGLVSLPNSLPPTVQTNFSGATVPSSIFIQDQSPTNALATGDSRSFQLSVKASTTTLHVTLAWTDPPGNPAAAIKLVNNLDLIVSNKDTGATYFGNDIPAGGVFNTAEIPTNTAALDSINNVQSVILPSPLATNYTVTVVGRGVNVNAVSAQTNNATGSYAPNVVQDYALVISSGDGGAPGSFTVTDNGIVSIPTSAQDITFVTTTNQPLLNQLVGANSPVLNTNAIAFTTNAAYGIGAQDTLGLTNQWHFYVVANTGPTADYTNAGFVTFLPPTLSLPREGVFSDSQANATRPQADIDLFVTTDPTLTNLNPTAIASCINGTQIGASSSGVFYGASLSRGGTEYVVDTNSMPGEVYYIGVKSEDQLASEYDFFPIFSNIPFSELNPNGDQVVNGVPTQVNIPDGTPAKPGVSFILGLALFPIQVANIIATNVVTHQNFGDLYGTLTHSDSGTGTDTADVLNNHDAWQSVVDQTFIYNESSATADNRPGPIIGPSDGPGSLNLFTGLDGSGVWRLTEVDDSFSQTGRVVNFTMVIQPHRSLTSGVTNTIPPHGYFTDFVDVPPGATNLTINATNVSTTPDMLNPLLMVIKFGSVPTVPPLTDADKGPVSLVNGSPPGNSLSVGPTDVPPIQPGRYWVGITNRSDTAQAVFVIAVILPEHPIPATTDFASTGATPILDDAVSYATNYVGTNLPIASMNVGIVVQHPRISDLVFHLISPDGTRVLLMENRGGTSTNGAGAIVTTTNVFSGSASGGPAGATNFYDLKETSGTFPISWNFFMVPDQMDVYYQGTNIFSTGLVSGTGTTNISFGPGTSTQIEVVMDQNWHPPATLWTYTLGSLQTNFAYLTFTEDTNLTITPIKFAPPPFLPNTSTTNVFADSFEDDLQGIYTPGSNLSQWTVLANSVVVTTNPPAFDGINLLALQNGAVSNTLPTVRGRTYALSYQIGSTASDSGSPATNAGWQPVTATFIATQDGTPLVLDASGGGLAANSLVAGINDTNALFDDFTLTELPGNLYYQPEQTLDTFNGGNAAGPWQLEIQDDRAGAGLTNLLLSWELQFVFANTNPVIPTISLTNGGSTTNFLPPGATAWFLVNVPTNADLATNTLQVFNNLPLNFLFSTNAPPTTTNSSDVLLLTTATTGSAVFGTNPPTPFFVPGGSYYLGVQNTNTSTATYAVNVTFHLLPAPPLVITLPATKVISTNATLNAGVVPNGLPTTVYFEYGTDTNYGAYSASVLLTSNLNIYSIVSISVSNLLPGTVYHFQAIATNAVGTNYGGDLTFKTPYSTPPPFATTMPATLANGASAQLNGMATANGTDATAWFEWGTSTAYGLTTTNISIGTNYNVVYVTNQIAGLMTNLPYHFRLVVSNIVGVTHGFDQVFDQANVAAWGADFFGQTTPIPAGLTNLAVGIGAGYDFSLAVNNNGTVVAWGDNTFGQTNVPAGLNNAVAVSGGEKVSLALRSDRSVLVWGSRQFGQTNVPPDLTNAVAAMSGGYHCLALRADGNPVAWGLNTYGQTNVPAGLSNVVAVTAGDLHSLALRNDGTVVAWGYDADGETDVPAGLSNVVAIAAGYYHNLALRNDGTVVAWGYNDDGQTDVPSGLNNVVAVAAGGFHSLALKSDGKVVIWGDNSSGQYPPPFALSNVVAVAGGGLHSLALTSLFGLNQTNNAPFWLNGLNGTTRAVNELTTLVVTNTAMDTNFPPQTLTYTVTITIDTNAMIVRGWPLTFVGTVPAPVISNNGIITWTPTEAQGPGVYFITTVVKDNGKPPLSATNRFTVIVNEVNTAPHFFLTPSNLVVGPNTPLVVTNAATDADIPPNPLFYSLLNPPAGALIDTNTGIITWTPTPAQAGTTNVITTIVTDTNPYALFNQSLSATNQFTVIVTNVPSLPAYVPSIASIIYTNGGFLLTWFAPSNDLFQVEWTASLAPIIWNTFSNIVSYNTNAFTTPTNTQFNFFDDGSQTGGFGSLRFYRLILLQATNTLTLPVQTNLVVTNGSFVTVTNTATDSNTNLLLTYTLVNAPTNSGISTNGIITWTNAAPPGLAARFTTVVVDNGLPPVTASNTFTIFVTPLPAISKVTVTTTNVVLQWSAPTNDQFRVQWATNLASPIVWTPFPGFFTSTTGLFSFTDTNAPLLMKFYELILLP